ncbi:MAG: hypothetical protein JWQ38_520 [Flavipsychrobacter sp.]|nr:hypothetical protein [Flavipsychrobacter sp.]
MKKNLLLIALLFFTFPVFAAEGVYLEFRITSTNINGTSKTYNSAGNVRSEMTMTNARSSAPMSVVTLKLHNEPNTVYSLNEKDKTYTVTNTQSTTGYKEDDFDVEIVGKEKIGSYNCTHVNIVYKKTGHKNQMWLSRDIPGYASYTSVEDNYLGGSEFFDKLKAKGADGFVVRMLINGGRSEQIQMDLVKAEKKNIDAGMFSVSGYTKSATPANMTADQLKSMTPEQRQEYLKQMRERYNKQR